MLHFYVGIRPLIDNEPDATGPKDSYKASREAEVCDHKRLSGIDGFISALGGKWTTSRHLAELIVDMATQKLGRKIKCETHCTPVYGGEIGRLKSFIARAKFQHNHLAEDVVENLVNFYGSRIDEVLATADENQGERADLLRRLMPESPVLGVQIVHAIRHEMAQHMDDIVFRRTLGHPGVDMLNRIAELMARELGWDDTRMATELAATNRLFETQPRQIEGDMQGASMAEASR